MYVFLLLCLAICHCAATTWLDKGEICRKRDNTTGICKDLKECTSAIAEIKANGQPEICSFDGKYPIVCCRSNNATNDGGASNPGKNENLINMPLMGPAPGSGAITSSTFRLPFDENNKILKICRNFYKKVIEYIPPDAFIGGRWSEAKEFPHMALLGYGDTESKKWQCGGSLISLEFVLTAAHCLRSKSLGKVQFVRLGELDLNSTTDDAEPQDFTVKETYAHSDYTSLSSYHDIALIRLDRPVRPSAYVKPACLPVLPDLSYSYPVGMGWGLTSRGGQPANVLQAGALAFVPYEKCKKIYGTSVRLKNGIVEELQLCADGGGKIRDTCQGDSGGPLQNMNYRYDFNSFPEIIGITSFGKECGLTAGVYTRVYHYVPWIEKIVWPN